MKGLSATADAPAMPKSSSSLSAWRASFLASFLARMRSFLDAFPFPPGPGFSAGSCTLPAVRMTQAACQIDDLRTGGASQSH